PSIVSDLHIERAAAAEIAEHELLGDILEAQAAKLTATAIETASPVVRKPASTSAAATVAESTLRVDAPRIDAVMNLVGGLIIGKSMLHRGLSEFDQRHSRDPARAKLSETLSFQSPVLDALHACVIRICIVPLR